MGQEKLAIIIPAWHCRSSISRSLASIASQSPSGFCDVHVIVAVNDGQQSSLEAAEEHSDTLIAKGFRVSVLATPAGRKAAFRAAEALTELGTHFLYLDQDAALSSGALRKFYRVVVEADGPRFIAFSVCFTESPSWAVNRFLTSWLAFPYIKSSPVVAGAYGVTATGRQRWQTVPAELPDDKFVRMQFAHGQRVLIEDERYEVLSPSSYRQLLNDRVRYIRSNRKLAKFLARGSMPDAPRIKGWHRQMADPVSFAVLAITIAIALALSLHD